MYDYAPTLSDVFNEDTCQKIEEKSHAVLIRDGDCRLIIQGSDQEHVLIALSIVEDIVARVETNVSASSGHNSSAMLDKVLKRAYSDDGEAEDGFDWSTMPEEVKRAVLVSLLDSNEPEVTVIDLDMEGIADNRSESPAAAATDTVVTSFASSSNAAAPASVNNTLSSGTVSKVVDSSPPKLDITDPAIQPLVNLAMSKGYSVEEIENVLLSKAVRLKESEFLRILHTNRRLQSASSQQASISSTFQQPAVLLDSIVNSASSKSADETLHIHTFDQSPMCSVTGSRDVHLQGVGTGSAKRADDEGIGSDNYIIIDEAISEMSAVAGNDSVILLKSDQESSDDDDDDDDDKNMEVEIDINARLMALASESEVPVNSAVWSDEQTQKSTAVELGGSSKRKKKKRKKKQNLPHTVAHQKEESPPTMKTGPDINDLDCISLIPAAPSSAVVKSNIVVMVSDNSDCEITDMSEDVASMQPVVDRNERRQLARQKEESNPRQLNIPAAAFTSVPAVATGVRRYCYFVMYKLEPLLDFH